ncbi:MAG: PAS domain-containing protein [Candidatus Nitrohelix vancouverensis]|uniref:protein-glutamate O-methyltransferase n=1 Tax=Candidatus Nitrohelix vancouverensis TaxID=2705534 RepID=A0A7T0C4J9_9BACT|nr:MAG: PAS domain-containing protein [Candidatus Nitrohelix vancouverensis]
MPKKAKSKSSSAKPTKKSDSKSPRVALKKSRSKTKVKKTTAGTASKPKQVVRVITSTLHSFPIVGVGASAGGLEALEEFFANFPANPDVAFVIITHQQPNRHSLLPELLGKCTNMAVSEITDGLKVKPNCVYLSPPGKNVAISKKTFQLSDCPLPRGSSLPIDFFLNSLAEDQKGNAICIILSGIGTDGTLGLRAIKGESGMSMAQEGSTAKFNGMPNSAFTTGLVDYILPPGKMPSQLIKYIQHSPLKSEVASSAVDLFAESEIQKIIMLLKKKNGNDFSMYKLNTVRRRIERRMAIHHFKEFKEYTKFFEKNASEASVLFNELLIGVTSFFRDADSFDYLKKKILPAALKSKKEGETFRVWAPGCSSGEEVYSLAILLRECLDTLNKRINIQIFGTDLDPHAIDAARAGLYPEGIAANVSSERLQSFFQKEDDSYRIRKDIRETAIFAQQNVTQDPPFTKLDLISCRNLLIYLNNSLQGRIISLFHYSLNPGGVLFLGSSETTGRKSNLFQPINKKWRFYTRNEVANSMPASSVGAFSGSVTKSNQNDLSPKVQIGRVDTQAVRTLAEKYMVKHLLPSGVVVDSRGEIFHIHGKTGQFLEHTSGVPSLNVLTMVRDELKVDLASSLRQASHAQKSVIVKGTTTSINGKDVFVNLTVHSISDLESLQALYLVTFEIAEPSRITGKTGAGKSQSQKEYASIVEKLKKELQYTRESLQRTIEELEATNEELKSTNEELQSTNEELQSSNEEIETSKEEMQSLNEELQTTNSELQSKIDEYSQANDDMNNLLNSTNIATIFLDSDLRIKRFTTEAKKVIHLIASDIGRPVSDIVSKLKYDRISEDFREVLDTLVYKEVEVQTSESLWYQIRIFPYRTSENKIDGLVVTFSEITKLKEADMLLKKIQSN